MTLKEHKKHVSLVKPGGGKIHRNELAFLGAPCGIIQSLCASVASKLPDYRFGFVDADHSEGADKPVYTSEYTDKISYHTLSFQAEDVQYDLRHMMNDSTMVLVNGNHFKAASQVVFIHEKKKESLHRKLDRLKDVRFFILADDQTDIYDFLKEHDPGFNELPKYRLDDLTQISREIESMIGASIPEIKGLVLAGGKSTRMGQDKGEIRYHGKPQRDFMADLLASLCGEAYISTQGDEVVDSYPVVEDTFTGLGPFGGILSAFRKDPACAWLTVATDIPLVNEEVLNQLIAQRDPNKMATCFHNPETKFPEPLITLWEPKAYPRLLHFLSLGYSCPRKVLINSEVNEIHLDNPEVLFNANTPEEMQIAMDKING